MFVTLLQVNPSMDTTATPQLSSESSPAPFTKDQMILYVACFIGVVLATTIAALIPSVKSDSINATTDRTSRTTFWTFLLSPTMGLRRKFQHATSGLLILYLYNQVLTQAQSAGLLLFSAFFLFVMHRLRLIYPSIQRVVISAFGSLIRPHEYYRLPGAFWVLFGGGLCVLLFGQYPLAIVIEEDAASPSGPSLPLVVDIPGLCFLILSIGDPLASLIGTAIGTRDRWRIGGKSLFGSFSMIVVCTLVSQQYLIRQQVCQLNSSLTCDEQLKLKQANIWSWSLTASIIGGLLELFEINLLFGPLDDNLRIPFGTGCLLWLMKEQFRWWQT